MAAHVLQQIYDAAVAKLQGLNTPQARVYAARTQPMLDANMPGLRIFLEEDTGQVSAFGGGHSVYERQAQLVVECCVKVVDLDARMLAMRQEVEQALYADRTLGGLAKTITLPAADPDRGGDLEKDVGVYRLTFLITYFYSTAAVDQPR